MTADEVITGITEAPTTNEALAILVRIPRATLEDVADQLYVDIWGKSLHTVRIECLQEARA